MSFARALVVVLFVALGCSGGGVATVDGGPPDAFAAPDGSIDAANVVDDAGTDAAAIADTGTDAFASAPDTSVDTGPIACDESHVHFVPPGGHLQVGQLCDDVFVCPAGAAEATRVADLGFECSATSEGGCTGTTCVLRPSTLDANELQRICAVISVASPPETSCVVYL